MLVREIIVSIVTAIVVTATYWTLDGVRNIELSIPENAVVAFIGHCPKGAWRRFKEGDGLFLKGAPDQSFGNTGGSATLTLEIKHMPEHKHDTQLAIGEEHAKWERGDAKDAVHGSKTTSFKTGMTSSKGQGVPINIEPPFIELTLCRKIE